MLVATLAWTACSVAGSSAPSQIEQGQDFSLKVGESAQTRDGALRIGFDGVTGDSRCAKGEQCVRAGDATVRLWLQQGTGPKETRELQAAPGAAQTGRAGDYFVRLVRLDPVPITGRAIASVEYVATLRLSRNAAVESDR